MIYRTYLRPFQAGPPRQRQTKACAAMTVIANTDRGMSHASIRR